MRPLLIELRYKGYWTTLLLITHINQDYIEGAIALLDENGQANNPNVIPIGACNLVVLSPAGKELARYFKHGSYECN